MIGQTFQPGADEELRKRLNQQTGSLGPNGNEALKIMSLRMPNVLSGRPIAPDDLLKPNVGGVQPGSAVTDTMSRRPGGPASALSGAVSSASGGAAGSGEYGKLIDLITEALHATPRAPSITPATDPTQPDMGGGTEQPLSIGGPPSLGGPHQMPTPQPSVGMAMRRPMY